MGSIRFITARLGACCRLWTVDRGLRAQRAPIPYLRPMDLRTAITRDLALTDDALGDPADDDQLLDRLTEVVQQLIDEDFERLLLALYRIDVSEARVKRAIEAGAPGEAARVIATLVLERERQKAATRRRIDEEGTDWIFGEG